MVPTWSWRRITDRTSTEQIRSGDLLTVKTLPVADTVGAPSATNGATTDAPTTSTFSFECGDGVLPAQPSLAAVFDPFEDFVDGRGRGDQCQPGCQILLERLAGQFGLTDQGFMDFFGHVTHLHIGHACIIHADD